MKLVQAVTKSNLRWRGALKRKEIELRGKGTTWYRVAERRWKHRNYWGWVAWDEAVPGLLVAKVQSLKEDQEWQILNAFVGFLNRHFGKEIQSITICYR